MDAVTEMTWWTREYHLWPWPRVMLRQWHGTRWQHSTTGEGIWVSVPRYWWLWWRVFLDRRSRHRQLPRATVRR